MLEPYVTCGHMIDMDNTEDYEHCVGTLAWKK